MSLIVIHHYIPARLTEIYNSKILITMHYYSIVQTSTHCYANIAIIHREHIANIREFAPLTKARRVALTREIHAYACGDSRRRRCAHGRGNGFFSA